MISMLEQKEYGVITALEDNEKALAMGEELESRLKLEEDFFELCKKEETIMNQLEQLRQVEQPAA